MKWVSSVIMGLLWAVAMVSFFFGTASCFGLVFCAAGAIVGTILECVLSRKVFNMQGSEKQSMRQKQRLKISLPCSLALFLFTYFLPTVIQFLPWDAMKVIQILESSDLFLKTFSVCFFFRSLSSCYSPMLSMEITAIAFMCAGFMSEHRYGNICRPYWLMDYLTENGYMFEKALWSIALPALIMIAAIPFISNIVRPSFSKILAFIFILPVLSLLTYACVIFIEPPMMIPSMKPSIPPLPPSNEPPPPPPPEKIALVKLETLYRPPERFGGFYFRTGVSDSLKNWGLEAASNSSSGETWASFPAGASNIDPEFSGAGKDDSSATEPKEQSVKIVTTVYIIKKDVKNPLALVSPLSYNPVDIPDARFTRAYRIESAAPGIGSTLEDINLDNKYSRQTLENPAWTTEQKMRLTQIPEDSRLTELCNTITGEIEERRRRLLVPKVAAVVSYLNKNGIYSSRKGKEVENETVDKFLFGDLTGGSKQFAFSAILLLRAAGVPARLACGYRVSRPSDEETEKLLINEAHWAEWPEIYLAGTGWLPLMITPEKVLDRESPPPENDIEEILADIVQQKTSQIKAGNSNVTIIFGILYWSLLIPLFFLMLFIIVRIWIRYISFWLVRKDQEAMRIRAVEEALKLLAACGYPRQYGETYMMFSKRIIGRDRRDVGDTGKALGVICEMSKDAYEHRRIITFGEWNRALNNLSISMTKAFFFTPWNVMPWRLPVNKKIKTEK